MIGKFAINVVNFFTLVLIFSMIDIEVSHAARHSLLVGVGNYPVSSLEGPVNDVMSVKTLLQDNWDFSENNITVLLDKNATKKNILKELDSLFSKTKKDDEIFVYFSGHGTSASDHDLNFPLPTTSGAFIPYDVRDAKTITEAMNKLIIGKTDLKPILSKLDKGGRRVFIAIDACYSGNAVRGILKTKSAQLPSRYLDISALLPARAFGDDLVNTGDDVWKPRLVGHDEPYPYKNIYYLSASGEHEQAKDIPLRSLKQNPTIDGKAHGAFTDTLLRVLSDPTLTDVNSDGSVSYHEITKSVRRLMRQRGFDHTPNGLPSMAEDSSGLASRGIFRSRSDDKSAAQQGMDAINGAVGVNKISASNTTASILRVELESGFDGLSEKLGKLKNVKLVDKDGDIVLRKDDAGVMLISRAGDLIARENFTSEGISDENVTSKSNFREKNEIDASLVKLIQHQAWVHQLVNDKMQQDFNIYLDISGNGRGSVAITDEEIGFSVSSDRSMDTYLLLVDIDPHGTINVIYPYYREELKPFQAKDTFVREKIAKVGPPYGRDFVQVYAFDRLTSDLKQLVAATIETDSGLHDVFQRLINDKTIKKARASMELVTSHR